MKHTAKVTTVLAIFAADIASQEGFQAISSEMKIRALGLVSAILECRYDLLEDEPVHEEFEKRFYESIVVPWCNLDERENEEH